MRPGRTRGVQGPRGPQQPASWGWDPVQGGRAALPCPRWGRSPAGSEGCSALLSGPVAWGWRLPGHL